MEFTKILLLSKTYRRTIVDLLETDMSDQSQHAWSKTDDMPDWRRIGDQDAASETKMPHQGPTCLIGDRNASWVRHDECRSDMMNVGLWWVSEIRQVGLRSYMTVYKKSAMSDRQVSNDINIFVNSLHWANSTVNINSLIGLPCNNIFKKSQIQTMVYLFNYFMLYCESKFIC